LISLIKGFLFSALGRNCGQFSSVLGVEEKKVANEVIKNLKQFFLSGQFSSLQNILLPLILKDCSYDIKKFPSSFFTQRKPLDL
jgi:hypothetical protein